MSEVLDHCKLLMLSVVLSMRNSTLDSHATSCYFIRKGNLLYSYGNYYCHYWLQPFFFVHHFSFDPSPLTFFIIFYISTSALLTIVMYEVTVMFCCHSYGNYDCHYWLKPFQIGVSNAVVISVHHFSFGPSTLILVSNLHISCS